MGILNKILGTYSERIEAAKGYCFSYYEPGNSL